MRIVSYAAVIGVLIMLATNSPVYADASKEKVQCESCVRLSMSEQELENLHCVDFVPFPENKVKHKINDQRTRKYYKNKPLLSVVMREIDINSYYELIFDGGQLAEINQYDLKGNFVKKHSKIYCRK